MVHTIESFTVVKEELNVILLEANRLNLLIKLLSHLETVDDHSFSVFIGQFGIV